MGQVLLNITRGAATAGCGKADVVGHAEVENLFVQRSIVQRRCDSDRIGPVLVDVPTKRWHEFGQAVYCGLGRCDTGAG